MFLRGGFLSAFIVILGDFCEVKFIRCTSLIFSTVIWSYVTPYLLFIFIVIIIIIIIIIAIYLLNLFFVDAEIVTLPTN